VVPWLSYGGGGLMISVAVFSSIRLYREGLADILDRQRDITVVPGETDVPPDLARIVRGRPNIIILDMMMSASTLIAREVATTAPEVMVVALGVPDSETHVLACAELGIAGYVPREGGVEDLLNVVRRVAKGEALYPPRIIATLLRRLPGSANEAQPPDCRLTGRELQIVELIDCGMTNKEIAAQLCVELATVKNHVHHILDKLHVRRRTEAATWIRAQRESASGAWRSLEQR
jgi:two-component system, NarL family, nitrate/nitrite response regulator NarL